MKSTLAAIAALCACTLIAACGKNYSSAPERSSYAPDAATLNALFAGLKPEPQQVAVAAGQRTTVTAANGTVMHFNPSSFKDADGNVITSGTVTLKVVEMYKTGDMIANRASTIANGRVLQSGGQINITATMNGKQVFANKYGVEFVQATYSPAPMNLFYGNNDNTYGVTTWANGGDPAYAGTIAYGTVAVGFEQHYVFDSCTHFGWTNCDQFYNADSPLTSVAVVMPDSTFNPSNTQVYLVLPSLKSVMSNADPRGAGIGGTDYVLKTNTINLISESQKDIVPIGLGYKFIVLTNKSGRFYYYETSGNITRELKLKATMAPKTKEEVKTLLAAL